MTENLSLIQIKSFDKKRLMEASDVLARAFVTNPLHETAFGPHAIEKNRVFFRKGLSVMKGPKLVAVAGERIVGFIHWVPSPHCQFSLLEKLRMTPSMVNGFGFSSAVKVSNWLAAWSRQDPAKAHIHLGPIGIEPAEQGRGIGRMLMDCYCKELDRTGKEGYLETDRQENVQFYRRFGFETIQELSVLGVRNYFMWRKVY